MHGRKKNNSEATQESAEYEHRNKRRREKQLRQLEATLRMVPPNTDVFWKG